MGRYDGWVIEEQPSGKVDLRHDRKAIAYDLDDEDEAIRMIRKKDPEATEVTLIEADGYRTRRRFRARQPG